MTPMKTSDTRVRGLGFGAERGRTIAATGPPAPGSVVGGAVSGASDAGGASGGTMSAAISCGGGGAGGGPPVPASRMVVGGITGREPATGAGVGVEGAATGTTFVPAGPYALAGSVGTPGGGSRWSSLMRANVSALRTPLEAWPDSDGRLQLFSTRAARRARATAEDRRRRGPRSGAAPRAVAAAPTGEAAGPRDDPRGAGRTAPPAETAAGAERAPASAAGHPGEASGTGGRSAGSTE
jgi:hypothetical protein